MPRAPRRDPRRPRAAARRARRGDPCARRARRRTARAARAGTRKRSGRLSRGFPRLPPRGGAEYNRPLMPEKLDELAAAIADRALARLRHEGFGRSVGFASAAGPEAEKDGAPGGCEPGPQLHSCGARAPIEEGDTRLTPVTIRASKE